MIQKIRDLLAASDSELENLQITLDKLTSLELTCCELPSHEARIFAKALELNHSITYLDLSWTSFGRDAVQHIARIIAHNKTLNFFDLNCCRLLNAEMLHITTALKYNNTITSLNLSRNDLRKDGVRRVFEAIKHNHVLTFLDISANNLGQHGVQCLAYNIETNETLSTLNISANNFGPHKAMYLAKALVSNKTLISLNAGTNNFGLFGTKSFVESLTMNYSLTSLDIGRIVFSNEERNMIETLCSDQDTISLISYGYSMNQFLQRNKLLQQVLVDKFKLFLLEDKIEKTEGIELYQQLSKAVYAYHVVGTAAIIRNSEVQKCYHTISLKSLYEGRFKIALCADDAHLLEFSGICKQRSGLLVDLPDEIIGKIFSHIGGISTLIKIISRSNDIFHMEQSLADEASEEITQSLNDSGIGAELLGMSGT